MVNNSGLDKASLIVIIVLAVLFVALIIFIIRRINRQRVYDLFEDMDGHEFEHYCADLLTRRGFLEVNVTKGSGDYGIDILCEKDGVSYAIQCKNYTSPVGVQAVMEAYAGRDYYEKMVGVVLSNQSFTPSAVNMAKKLKIMLWDGEYLNSMMGEADTYA